MASSWLGGDTILHASREWSLTCEPEREEEPWPFELPFPFPVRSFAEVNVVTWPSRLRAERTAWTRFVDSGFRESLDGVALADVEATMTEVRKIAPTAERLEQLRAANERAPDERRTFVGFGEYLDTFWPEAAASTNWALLDDEARVQREEARLEREALEAQSRAQAEAVVMSNARALRLMSQLRKGAPLECPHCGRSTRDMRFIEPGPRCPSYFICGLCARSFSGSEAPVADEDESPA